MVAQFGENLEQKGDIFHRNLFKFSAPNALICVTCESITLHLLDPGEYGNAVGGSSWRSYTFGAILPN